MIMVGIERGPRHILVCNIWILNEHVVNFQSVAYTCNHSQTCKENMLIVEIYAINI